MHFNYRYILIPIYKASFQDVGDCSSPRIPILLIGKKCMSANHDPWSLFSRFRQTCQITGWLPPSPSVCLVNIIFLKRSLLNRVPRTPNYLFWNLHIMYFLFRFPPQIPSWSQATSTVVTSCNVFISSWLEAIYTRLCSEYSSG